MVYDINVVDTQLRFMCTQTNKSFQTAFIPKVKADPNVVSKVSRLVQTLSPSIGSSSHWIAVIIPDSQFHLKPTWRYLNQYFSETVYLEMGQTYACVNQGVETTVIGVAIAWMDTEALNQHWNSVLEYATNLQRTLNQPYIKVFRDGDLILACSWQ
ncbi:MAG: hypothetical protein WB539_00485 [Planktothrix agardhii]|jgi:hypothetical protein|uniref:hypothetical protein n=1 Tax=Planktothrix agardhii TaxID=1160 RepID=UPI003C3AB8FC